MLVKDDWLEIEVKGNQDPCGGECEEAKKSVKIGNVCRAVETYLDTVLKTSTTLP